MCWISSSLFLHRLGSGASPPYRLGEIVKSSTFGNNDRRISKVLWVGEYRGIRALLPTYKEFLRRIVV
jgi:hypothetical protein